VSVTGMLTQTCTVQTFTPSTTVRDGAGHPTGTWADTYTLVPCRLTQWTPGREVVVGKEAMVADFLVFLPASPIVTERNRIANVSAGNAAQTLFSAAALEVLNVTPGIDGGGGLSHQEVAVRLVR